MRRKESETGHLKVFIGNSSDFPSSSKRATEYTSQSRVLSKAVLNSIMFHEDGTKFNGTQILGEPSKEKSNADPSEDIDTNGGDTIPRNWKQTLRSREEFRWINRTKTLATLVYRPKGETRYRFEVQDLVVMALDKKGEPVFRPKVLKSFESRDQALKYAGDWMEEHADYYPKIENYFEDD